MSESIKAFFKTLRYSFHILVRPIDGFWDMKHERRGSLPAALLLYVLYGITYVMQQQLTGFLFNHNNIEQINILAELGGALLIPALWCIANWSLTTLMDGNGKMRDIMMATGYALLPMILINVLLIGMSYILSLEEGSIYTFFSGFQIVWTLLLALIGTMSVHEFTFGKAVGTSLLSVVAMLVIIFLVMLAVSVIQQIVGFGYSLFKEVSFRF